MTNSPRKICWVISNEFVVRSFLIEQIAALQSKYTITLIVNTDNPRFLEVHGLSIRVIPVRLERKISVWWDIHALIRLIRIFSRERFDVVHSITPKAGLLAMLASWFVRVPWRIHTFQGEVWATRTGFWRNFLKFLDWLVARLATHLLVVSPSERMFLLAHGVITPEKSAVLANGSICGVNTNRFRPNADARKSLRQSEKINDADIVILYMGRLTTDKGLLDLARAFSRICNAHSNIHLMVVGPDEENMRDQMLSFIAPDHHRGLHFSPYTPNPESYFATADILCLPSYREGFGVVLIEAAATGIPAVGSRIYGISDAIEEEATGLLHAPGNIDELVACLARLITNRELRHSMGLRARLRACERFSSETVTAAMLHFYAEIVNNSAPTHSK